MKFTALHGFCFLQFFLIFYFLEKIALMAFVLVCVGCLSVSVVLQWVNGFHSRLVRARSCLICVVWGFVFSVFPVRNMGIRLMRTSKFPSK